MWVFAYGSLIWRVDFPYERRVRCFVCGHLRRLWQGSSTHRGTPERPGRVVTLVPHPIPPDYLQVRDCLDNCPPTAPLVTSFHAIPSKPREDALSEDTQEDGLMSETRVWGVAYLLGDSYGERVLAQLDDRERIHLHHFRRISITCYPAQLARTAQGIISNTTSEQLLTTYPHSVSALKPGFDFELDCDSLISPFEALTYIGDTRGPGYLGPASEAAIAERVASSTGPSGANSEYVLELVRALRRVVPHASGPTARADGDELVRWDSHLLAVDARVRSALGIAGGEGEGEGEGEKAGRARTLPPASNPPATTSIHEGASSG